MSKIRCYNCGELGHFAWDCTKPRKNANIARENEQNRKLAKLMDLGDNSVCEESKEIQCCATFGHALARVSPSHMQPPVT